MYDTIKLNRGTHHIPITLPRGKYSAGRIEVAVPTEDGDVVYIGIPRMEQHAFDFFLASLDFHKPIITE